MVFIETATFTSQITKLASDDEQREFQNVLVANPDAGDVIPAAAVEFARFGWRSAVGEKAAERA